MQKSLLVALWLTATAWHVPGASIPFVTAGFPLYPQTILFATPDLMWTNTPVGQEFVPGVPRIDFADVHFGGGGIAHYQIVLHERTITGLVAAASEVVLREDTNAAMTRFTFSPAATVSPGAPYVLEFVRQEPMPTREDSPEIYRPAGDYPSGDRIWHGVREMRRDLYFRVGVYVPSLFSTNRPTMVTDGVTRYFDPAATFNNLYITNFDGATLQWELGFPFIDSISLASEGTAEIGIAPDGDIYYNGGAFAIGRVLTNLTSSGSITVQFNALTDTNAVNAVMRSLLFTATPRLVLLQPSFSSTIIISPPLPPTRLVPVSWVHIRFTHPAGQMVDSVVFSLGLPNTPPAPHILVMGGHSFLNGGPVFITRRLQRTVSVECNIGGLVDGDGDLLTFEWWLDPTNTLSTLPCFTNDYAPGLHFVGVTVSDGRAAAGDQAAFEVITPREAIKRLRADVKERNLGSLSRRLETPLRFAAYAIETREWNLASRQLQVFRNRLGSLVEDEELYTRWSEAAGDLKYAVARLPRNGVPGPPGPFPGPSTVIPTR